MKTILLTCVAASLLSASAAEWKNVDDGHHLGGRKASAGYLKDKVVLVDRWGAKCPPCRALLPRLEQLWQSFKMKQFVLLGGHCAGWGGAEEVKALVKANKLTYPVYEDAGLAADEPKFDAIPYLYVVDETGKVVYRGHDERDATQAIVQALTDMDVPTSVEQWKRFLDYEIEQLPAHAYNRLNEFRKKHPKEAKAYQEKEQELKKIPEIKKVADLVAFAKRAKDAPNFTAREKGKKRRYEALVSDVLKKCAPLKDVADPRLQQEAKNSLAELVWAKTAF